MQQAQKQPTSSVPAYRGFADDTTNLTASSGSAAAQSQQKRGIATPPMSFKECVFKVKDVYEKSTNMLDNMVKLNVIQQYLQQYFEDEDQADVFEGFARLVIHLDKFTSQLAKQHDLSLVKVALSCYHTFVQAHPELGEKPKVLEEPDIVIKALKILSELKVKHAPLIIEVFHLKNALMQAAAQDMIMAILLKEDYAKAVHWMALLNLRDNFPFDKIASQLILDNQRDTLDLFVGESEFRRRKMLRFLDEILECQWKNRSANDELKTRLILDSKRVGKLAVSLVKSYNMNDSEVPYVMLHRAYQALIYHHLGWEHGERSWNHFEELALPAIREHPEMRHKYFSFLFNKGLGDKALYFAQLINLPYGAYSAQLKYHCEQHPEACSSTREKIAQNTEIRLRNEEIEQQNECQLDSGEPIRLVDTMEALDELVDLLRHGDQKLIGIDAEWRPHFLSAYELVSIIQIATAKAVYIVDVYILDKEEKLAEEDWLKFFDALFCTEGLVKIGYDIANDIRVLRSTFPFITKTFANANSVICLYRLFRQIMVIPEAQTTVFGSHAPKDLGLALSDMVHHFLGVQLEKSERIGNWGLRPLRLEQLKYAAQDAHCLVQLYQKISPLILSIGDDTQIALQHAALMNLKVEEKEKQQLPHLLADGQQVRSAKEGEGDFALNVQKGAAELLSKVAGASSAPTKSVKDVRFVADSMLFGLGKNLRKCGIKTELIGERSKIIDFCQEASNKDYIVLSTGKAYKQLEAMLGEDRLLYVPVSTHTGAVPPSMLVNHVMRELNIIIRPEDIYSRCMDCNKRGFVRFPMPVVRVLFYMNVIRLGAEWLDITQEDLQDAFIKLRGESALTVQITPGLHTGEEPRQNPELLPSDDAYYLYEDRSHLMCETRHCAMDLITKLLIPHHKDGPVAFHVGLKFKKSTFEEPDLQFFVCTGCGKMQYKSGNGGGGGGIEE